MNIYKCIYFILGMNDSKIKGLRPTLRVKKRFLLVQIVAKESFDFKTLSFAINEHIIKILGAYSYGKFGIWILREQFEYKTQCLVLKCTPQSVDILRSTLTLLLQISNTPIRLKILNVSGTLKQLKKLKNN